MKTQHLVKLLFYPYFDSFEFVKELYVDIVGWQGIKTIINTTRTSYGYNLITYAFSNADKENDKRILESLWNITQTLFDHDSNSLKNLLLKRNNMNKSMLYTFTSDFLNFVPLLPFINQTFTVDDSQDFAKEFLKEIRSLSLEDVKTIFRPFEGNNSFLRFLYKFQIIDEDDMTSATIFTYAR